LDSEWDLEDLATFPAKYLQSYSFIYFFDSYTEENKTKIIDDALINYPWKGGYSYTNIYYMLQSRLPKEDKPKVKSIKYASPGWLDLSLNYGVALQVAQAVAIIITSGVASAKAYRAIQKNLSAIKKDREANKFQIAKLSAFQTKYLIEQSNDLAKSMGFKNYNELNRRTKDPEVSAKLLAAHYRRLKNLSEFVESGKTKMPLD
jgi:hypothetical protein